jgi:hypothetical protein
LNFEQSGNRLQMMLEMLVPVLLLMMTGDATCLA